MKAREFHPRRLDVRPFAEAGEPIDGNTPLGDFERLLHLRHTEAALDTAAPVRWSVQGELRTLSGSPPEVWLYLSGSTSLSQQCQRCLETVEVPLAFERWFHAESEDDVLVLSRQFDLLELVEDELLLVAPIVPRHEVCPTPVTLSVGDWSDEPASPDAETGEPATEAPTSDKPNPFAVLAALRKTLAKE
jgi:uncharacterized protein